MTATLDTATRRILDAVLTSTSLESALYPNNSMGLPDDVAGSEFPGIRQNTRPAAPMSPEQIERMSAFDRDWMKDNWGLTDAQIDALPGMKP